MLNEQENNQCSNPHVLDLNENILEDTRSGWRANNANENGRVDGIGVGHAC